MYNAYKHGYRLLLGKDDADDSDIVIFIVKGGEEGYSSLKNELILDARKLITRCRTLLDCIFENHRTRLEYEGNDYNIFSSSNRVETDSSGRRTIKHQLILEGDKRQSKPLNILYPTRGEKTKQERKIADSIYQSLKNMIADSDEGKFIALDIDNKEIITISFDIGDVISTVQKRGPTGRAYIRRIGTDGSTGIPIY